jgi:hypothetical protein
MFISLGPFIHRGIHLSPCPPNHPFIYILFSEAPKIFRQHLVLVWGGVPPKMCKGNTIFSPAHYIHYWSDIFYMKYFSAFNKIHRKMSYCIEVNEDNHINAYKGMT